MKVAYHFLKDNMCGGYGNEPAWAVGETRCIPKGKIALCERGYHSSPSWYDALGYAQGSMACIVQVSKPIAEDDSKQVSRERKLVDARDATKVLRTWGCDCAERALKKAKVTDKRSWNAIKVARLFNDGKATPKELADARDDARDAAYVYTYAAAAADASRAATRDARAAARDARAAARAVADAYTYAAAARDAADARDAARDARAASWAAARDARAAARAVAWAARDATWAATWAAWDASWEAAGAAWAAADASRAAEIKWQKRHLNKLMKELIEKEEK